MLGLLMVSRCLYQHAIHIVKHILKSRPTFWFQYTFEKWPFLDCCLPPVGLDIVRNFYGSIYF